MMKENYSPNNIALYLYEKDRENKMCVECKVPKPDFASINNGILICNQCAEKLRPLGYNISYIRRLSDDWDQFLLCFMEFGGNSRYIRFLNYNNLNNMSLEEKFKSKIMEYYRLNVSAKKNYNIFLLNS